MKMEQIIQENSQKKKENNNMAASIVDCLWGGVGGGVRNGQPATGP